MGPSGLAAGVILKLWSLWVLSAAHPLPVTWVDFQFTSMNCKRVFLLTISIKGTCKSFLNSFLKNNGLYARSYCTDEYHEPVY